MFTKSNIHALPLLSCIIQVAVINFSKNYSDYEKPACVNVNNSSLVLSMTVPHDIIMTDSEIKTEVVRDSSKTVL